MSRSNNLKKQAFVSLFQMYKVHYVKNIAAPELSWKILSLLIQFQVCFWYWVYNIKYFPINRVKKAVNSSDSTSRCYYDCTTVFKKFLHCLTTQAPIIPHLKASIWKTFPIVHFHFKVCSGHNSSLFPSKSISKTHMSWPTQARMTKLTKFSLLPVFSTITPNSDRHRETWIWNPVNKF